VAEHAVHLAEHGGVLCAWHVDHGVVGDDGREGVVGEGERGEVTLHERGLDAERAGEVELHG